MVTNASFAGITYQHYRPNRSIDPNPDPCASPAGVPLASPVSHSSYARFSDVLALHLSTRGWQLPYSPKPRYSAAAPVIAVHKFLALALLGQGAVPENPESGRMTRVLVGEPVDWFRLCVAGEILVLHASLGISKG